MSAPTNNSNSGGQDQLGLGALLQSVGQQLRQEVEARVAGARASVQESVQAIKEDAFKPSPLITEEVVCATLILCSLAATHHARRAHEAHMLVS
eukprot:m.70552 g.70552  ORF g.70552 m.70552 type:complete len:94 (-) comp14075_c0_seq2:1628-1909(-)